MISRTVKLYPNAKQAATLSEWFSIGTGVWNWALSKYLAGPTPTGERMRAQWPSYAQLCCDTRGHASRIGFNSAALQGILKDVDRAWARHKEGICGQPHRKGLRNRLASIPFRQFSKRSPRAVFVPSLGMVRARGHRDVSDERIIQMRIHRRPRGWYATLVLDAEPRCIPLVGDEAVGVDLGFSTLATLSTGEKIEHPRELQRTAPRIGQAARGLNRRLLGRLQQRLANARRCRNHHLSRDLVSRFASIYVSRDNLRGFQRRFGKSVLSAGHGELLTMLATKCRQAGRVYVEVPNRNSTRTCSSCGCLDGPTGLRGLSVREWTCACGATHDRDVNAAVNTLVLGAVLAHESRGDLASVISGHR